MAVGSSHTFSNIDRNWFAVVYVQLPFDDLCFISSHNGARTASDEPMRIKWNDRCLVYGSSGLNLQPGLKTIIDGVLAEYGDSEAMDLFGENHREKLGFSERND